MAKHSLSGRKQTSEHIAKRTKAMQAARALWTAERRAEFAQKVRNAIDNRSPEMKEAFAKCNIGREPWCKGKKNPQISGEKHWNWGNKMPQESIEKMRRALTGKKQSPELVKNRIDARAGYHHSEETKAKIGMANGGENNGCWMGGVTPYHGWSFSLREKIRDRDERKCRICGKPENGKHHDVHHIDYDKKNIAPENFVTLCHFCHGKTNHNRQQWQKFFKQQNDPPLTVGTGSGGFEND
jgi:5-methylcytosine-specific restriction endonuclease McrA